MELMLLLQSFKPEEETETLRQQVAQHINHLINTDFNSLVHLLYTIDVDEQKLKTALQGQPAPDAASLITDLIFARLRQKAASREQDRPATFTPGEELW